MMKRFDLKVVSYGTRMDDEPLYKLTVIDHKAPLVWMKSTDYEDMTAAEIAQTAAYFEAIQEMIA